MPWWLEALVGTGLFAAGAFAGIKLKGRAPDDPKKHGIGKK